ncbi:MAG: hypothetical protein J6C63_04910 [Lachnospiraceae bacterium]|nr:hypothetical protein [Lachnospiraceae bacterium]
MADRSNFRVIQGKSEAEVNISKKIRKHRMHSMLRVLLIVVVIIAIAAVLVNSYKNQVFSGYVITQKGDYQVIENTSYMENNGSIIRYSKDGISNTDINGEVLWNLTYEMQSPIVKTADGFVGVGDYNGHIVHLIDAKGNSYEVDTKLPIRDFAVSSTGYVAAILEDAGNSWINLFNKEGTKIVEAKATMSKTGYPIACSLSGEVMGVSYFYVDGDTMRSSVTFYNFGGVGENVTDHIVSSYDYANAVVPMVEAMNAETSFAVADNRLMFFEGSKKPVSKADILLDRQVQGVYYSDTHVGLLFYDHTGENKYSLDVYNTAGEKVVSHGFDMNFKDIIIRNDQIMIYNESECQVVGLNGKEKYKGTFEGRVHYVVATDVPRKFLVIINNGLATLEFE